MSNLIKIFRKSGTHTTHLGYKVVTDMPEQKYQLKTHKEFLLLANKYLSVFITSRNTTSLPCSETTYKKNITDNKNKCTYFAIPLMQIAKSFVIEPDSIVSIQTVSRSVENLARASLLSSFALCCNPRVQAKMEAKRKEHSCLYKSVE